MCQCLNINGPFELRSTGAASNFMVMVFIFSRPADDGAHTLPRKTLLQFPMLHRCAFLAFFQENHP